MLAKGARVLVYCPCNPEAPRVRPQTLDRIMGLQAPAGVRLDIVFGAADAPEVRGFDDIAAKYNAARQIVLQCEYEAMLTVEADMLPPADALLRLGDVDADVVYGLYCAREDGHPWLVLDTATDDGAVSAMSPSLVANMRRGQVVRSAGCGFGVTLIYRPALERVAFCRRGFMPPDYTFAADAAMRGCRQAHHLGVVCGHMLSDDLAVWPDPDAMWRYEAC